MRTIWSLIVAAVVSALPLGAAQAQSWPTGPIRLICPYAAGGSSDITARLLAEHLSQTLKQQVVVDNRVGAGGAIGIAAVAKAKPDGLTLGIGGTGPIGILPSLDPNLPYNVTRDLEGVAHVNLVDLILVAPADSKFRTIKDVVAEARANPGTVSFSSPGIAGPSHLAVEDIASREKVRMVHVPYGGDAPATTAVLGGSVTFGSVSAATAAPHVAAGKLRVLSVGGPQRVGLMPDVPTTGEIMGYSDYFGASWNVLVGPKGMPPEVVATLNKAINDIVSRPDVKEKFAPLGMRSVNGDAASVQTFIASENGRTRKLIEATGLKRE